MKKDLISIKDMTPRDVGEIFEMTARLKANPRKFSTSLESKTLALLFQKPSNRTRVSFEVGMYQLGGNALYLSPEEINLGVREPVKDVARTLSRYVDGIVIRTFSHKNVEELASYASIPVINGLSDFSHPCQALADFYTIKEKMGSLEGRLLAYIGDGNNVCTSLVFLGALTGVRIHVAAPQGYEPQAQVIKTAQALSGNAVIRVFNDPKQAAEQADILYTDVWASMGMESEAQARREAFASYQIDAGVLARAAQGAIVMHCLPAHRGEEITDEVIEGAQSVVFDQAENRLHVQKAILMKLMG